MASNIDWSSLLVPRYPSYKLEVEAFLDGLGVSASSDILLHKMYQAIRLEPEVSENLKLLYREALYGTQREVKARMRGRVANFKRALK